jgi:Dyp-type peroxidase family
VTEAARAPARLTVESRSDVQGFITTAYGHLPCSAYLFLRMHEAGGTRRWLHALEALIATSSPWPTGPGGGTIKPVSAMNVAFTAAGLAASGLPARVLCTFPPEFQEGIDEPSRSRVLGDTDGSSPSEWELGSQDRAFHAVLLLHGQDEAGLDRLCAAQRRLVEQSAGAVTEVPDSLQLGYRPASEREHFGFHDGIAQPAIAGIAGHGVPTGEFILGYENHYGVIPPTPVVPGDLDPKGLLPAFANPYHAHLGLRDLGRNGSFVVYRKLRQDVAAFWTFMKDDAVRSGRGTDPTYMVWLASKCMGRWPSGAPVALTPEEDAPRFAECDDFMYRSDPDGLACPLGAHVRRTNPRDVLKPYPRAQSLSMSEAHRLLRRGRAFGPPLFDASLLQDTTGRATRDALLDMRDDGQARGVHFFCVNASIRSQFEFVQQTWCNNPRFSGLLDNKDPVIGDQRGHGQPESRMTIPTSSGDHVTAALPRFVTVVAGAYLFMPSLTALRFLAAER